MSHEPFCCDAAPRAPADAMRMLESAESLRRLASEVYPATDLPAVIDAAGRLQTCAAAHLRAFGPEPLLLLRAPGRLNLFAEYLDMCGGDHMSVTLDKDIPAAASIPDRFTGVVTVTNTSGRFPGGTFSIQDEYERFSSGCSERTPGAWQEQTRRHPYRGRAQGDSLNYLLAPFLRLQWEHPEIPLRGVNLTIGPATLPVRGGVSSSSAMVVLGFLAAWLANRSRLPPMAVRRACRLLGEAEWYVGTRGGANDQTTILRGAPGSVLYNLHHLELIDTRFLPWLKGINVILCDSLWEADKAMEGNRAFNLRKAWIDLTEAFLAKAVATLREAAAVGGRRKTSAAVLDERFGWRPGGPAPLLDSRPELIAAIDRNFNRLGSLSSALLGVDWPAIAELISLLPETATLEEAAAVLETARPDMDERYGALSEPAAPGAGFAAPGEPLFKIRQTARFFMDENRISANLERILLDADERVGTGALQPGSPAYRRYVQKAAACVNRLQRSLRRDFEVSSPHLDRLIRIARRGPGALAAKLTGAGGGGCICILVEEGSAEKMLAWLDERFFANDRNFQDYRTFLERFRGAGDPAVRSRAEDVLERLHTARRYPAPCRFTVGFSRGAGVLDL